MVAKNNHTNECRNLKGWMRLEHKRNNISDNEEDGTTGYYLKKFPILKFYTKIDSRKNSKNMRAFSRLLFTKTDKKNLYIPSSTKKLRQIKQSPERIAKTRARRKAPTPSASHAATSTACRNKSRPPSQTFLPPVPA